MLRSRCCVHRARGGDRQTRVDAEQLAANGGKHGRIVRTRLRTNVNRHHRSEGGTGRHEHVRPRILVEDVVSHLGNDPDDLVRL
jgi:hypothetical protein